MKSFWEEEITQEVSREFIRLMLTLKKYSDVKILENLEDNIAIYKDLMEIPTKGNK